MPFRHQSNDDNGEALDDNCISEDSGNRLAVRRGPQYTFAGSDREPAGAVGRSDRPNGAAHSRTQDV